MDEQTGGSSSGAIDDAKKLQAPPRKVGMLSRTMLDDSFYFKIYVFDVGDSNRDYTDIKPVVRFKIPRVSLDMLTYCIVNSTVYVFRGYNAYGRLPEKKKSAYKLVLSPEALAAAEKGKLPGIDDIDKLTSIADMSHGKGCALALPTPDGKQILVFSGAFIFKESFEAFELLNVDNDSWKPLPRLPCRKCSLSDSDTAESCRKCESESLVNVMAFSFTEKFIFYLETDIGAFALDLRKKEWIWVDNLIGAAADWSDDYFETVEGRYAIMPGQRPLCEYDGTPIPGSEPTLIVYDFGDARFFCPKGDGPDATENVIQLSRFDPPRGSSWLKPLKTILFPLCPKDEETACCFVARRLEGWQTDEEGSEDEDEDEDEEEEEEEEEEEVPADPKEEDEDDFVDMEYLAWEPEEDEEDFEDMEYLAWEPEPDYIIIETPEPVKPEPESELEENFEEIYDPDGETRILIEQVCLIDLKSHPVKFSIPNAVRVRIPFHIRPNDVSFFTL